MVFEKLAMGFEELADSGQLTAIGHTKVTAVCLRTYYKLTKERLELFTFRRDAARQNILAVWKVSLKRGESCGVRECAVTWLTIVRLAKVTSVGCTKIQYTYA